MIGPDELNRKESRIDLNADLGEGYPHDRGLLARITSASVCCGAHAGDPAAILTTLDAAKELGVIVGAHPGFPDRAGFGRREQQASASEVQTLIVEQVEALCELAAGVGVPVRFLKPHGALYNQAQRQAEIARGVASAAVRLGLALLGQPRTLLATMAAEAGIHYIAEGFPDRRYRADGSLVSRSEPDALIHDPGEMTDHVQRLIEDGVETLCIHGDDPAAIPNVDRVRQILGSLGIAIEGFLNRDEG
jgi:UPF0271 protein